MTTMRDNGKANWKGDGTIEHIKLGVLQRIADALEALNQPFCQLIRDRKYWEERAKENEAVAARLLRSNRALRGHIKRRTRKQ